MAKKTKKSNRGGARPGSGRNLKYGEKAISISITVPEAKKDEIKQRFKNILKEYEV